MHHLAYYQPGLIQGDFYDSVNAHVPAHQVADDLHNGLTERKAERSRSTG